jgi:hypothetical protein
MVEKRVFSFDYDALNQKKFEKALSEEDYETALAILESFPNGFDELEKIEYLIIKNEGYRVIIEKLRKYKELGRTPKELADILKEHEQYKELGTIIELEAELEKVSVDEITELLKRHNI